MDYDKLFESLKYTGFQATNLGLAIDEVKRMIKWRLSDEPNLIDPDTDADIDPSKVKATIFLGYTSNMISCGVREIIRFLCKHKMVDIIVTTCGGIEEDIMKCLHPTYMGDFKLPGAKLRTQGLNRIGNLIVPNKTYCDFEDWMKPVLDQMYKEQQEDGTIWSPSKMIRRFGKTIDNEESVYYWCYKNDIPVLCPAITDGSIGDMLYFNDYRRKNFIVDIVQDIRLIGDKACEARKSGMIILGGGLVKHHINNANMLRNGADYAVFINTGQEYDGSDSGARPDEAVSWGKIKATAKPVKVFGDASLIFPLLVSQTFAKEHHSSQAAKEAVEKKE